MTKFNKITIFFVALVVGLIAHSGVAFAASCDSITLNGYIAPKNGPSTVWFEWGTNSSSVLDGSASKTVTKTYSTNSYFSQQLTGLSESTKYYYRTASKNVNGTVYGSVASFTTGVCDVVVDPPSNNNSVTATTNNASSIYDTKATLNGYISKTGTASASRWFEYGTSQDNLSKSTSHLSISSSGNISSSITGLTPNTTYYFRSVANNTNGDVYGSIKSFTTTGDIVNPEEDNPPTTTNSSTCDSATLNGYIAPKNGASTVWFEWSTNSSSVSGGSASRTNTKTFSTNSSFSQKIYDLEESTTYYYRSAAKNTIGTVYGQVSSFKTTACYNSNENSVSATTNNASSIYDTKATLNGYISKTGTASASRWFEYGTSQDNLSKSTSHLSISSSGNISSSITGLTPNTTYYFRAVGAGSNGNVFGNTLTFKTTGNTTVPDEPPTGSDSAACSSVTLNGYIAPKNGASTVWFEWSSNSGDVTGGTATKTASKTYSTNSYFSQKVTGLNENSTYYYRTASKNVNGTIYGNVISFKTSSCNIITNTLSVATNPATGIDSNKATLNGYVTKTGTASASRWFEYGTSQDNLSKSTSHLSISSSGNVSSSIAGLTPNTTYYFRAVGVGTNGNVNGSILSFKTLDDGIVVVVQKPSVTTNSATGVSQTSATLNGYINTNGTSDTEYWFKWGTSSTNLSRTTNRIATGSSKDVNSYISGLSTDTTYYFQIVGSNSAGAAEGSIKSFRTESSGEGDDNDVDVTVTTKSATNVDTDSATLNGYVDTNGTSNVTRWFEWGRTSSSLSNSTSQTNVGASGNVSSYISGLSSNTTYYYRVVAKNGNGTVYGSKLSFTTGSNGGGDDNDVDVTVTTKSATNVDTDSATLNGYVDTNGTSNVTRWFEWGRTSSSLSNSTSQTNVGASGNVSSYISGLSSNTTYYYRVVAKNGNGTVYGSKLSFTTGSNGGGDDDEINIEPMATTRSATNVSTSRATLNGYVDANDTPNTDSWFEWGRTSGSLSNSTSRNSQGSSDSSISSSITGLYADTTYYFRAVARNDAGISYGNTLNFTTSRNSTYDDNDYNNNDGVAPTAITMLATNVESTSATLNSLVLQSGNIQSSAWFEWGTTQSLGRRTNTKSIGSAPSVRHAEDIYGLTSGATYYFRIVSENEVGRNYGTINSFVAKAPVYIYKPAPAPVKKPIVVVKKAVAPVVANKTVTVVEHAEGVSSLIMLTITGEDDTIAKGVGETYTVTWRNLSNQDLTNVVLRVIVPESLTFESADDGTYSKPDGTHTLLISNLDAGEEGEMNLVLKGSNTLKANDLVVTTANIVYTDEYSVQGDALAYTTQRATLLTSVLGASIGSIGGISLDVIGWIILLILILILAIVSHNLYKRLTKKN